MSRAPTNGYRNMSNGSTPSMMSSSTPMQSQQRLATPTMANGPPTSSSPAPPGMSRAERFEDEKRRIVESCFSKLDANGQLAESYITHIRIQEDAQYPSTPPPPDSAADNKKPRLIIIAVRSTGRVRMHKARENTNGSFSIGKTWNLEELSAIESFSNISTPPQTEREAQYRQWAGSVGFTVTITKPYYWQAGTSKEKDFFIASCVKIYRKYTKGQVPELRGFEEREKAGMLGVAPGQQQQAQQPPPSYQQQQRPGDRAVSGGDGSSPATALDPPQPPFAQRDHSREGSRYRGSPGPPDSLSDLEAPKGPTVRQQSSSPRPGRFNGPTQPPLSGPRPFANQEYARSQEHMLTDGSRQEHYRRPGTSPGPPGQGRSPQPSQQRGLQTPSVPTSSVRSDSPAATVSSVALSRDMGPRVRQESPVRQRGYPPGRDAVSEERQQSQEAAPINTGANLFNATRQRWMANQPQIQPQQQPSPISPIAPQAPQLPPIETSSQSLSSSNMERKGSTPHPQTAISEVSSTGINIEDAAAIGALTSYWGPDTAPNSPQRQIIVEEPSSPPTPERSSRRPPISPRQQSEAGSFDLRPPPLLQAARRSPAPAEETDGSHYATPREGGSAVPSGAPSRAHSAMPTPATEDPPEIKPLSVQPKRASQEARSLAMPGAFSPSPLGPSPLGTPAETPGEERDEPDHRQVEREAEEQFRPGLGPMIKNKTAVRDRFAKAATAARAANAFKPRPGGAAEKIMKAKAEREAGVAPEPDGITGVVPRPTTRQEERENLAVKAPEESAKEVAPTVEVSSPRSPAKTADGLGLGIVGTSKHVRERAEGVQLTDEQPTLHNLEPADSPRQAEKLEESAAAEAAERDLFEQREAQRVAQAKLKRRSHQQERNLAALGIDKAMLEGKALDFEAILHDFGWDVAATTSSKALTDLEMELRREQGRLEAGSWLSSSDHQREDRIKHVDELLDKTIAECDDLDKKLTLYAVELGSLNDDIAFIEAQSQGLQVQSANQKVLARELEGLVETMSLDRRTLDPIRYGDLGDVGGVEEVEKSLVRLYRALITIDGRRGGEMKGELSGMKALREKREVYERESDAFCQRLMQFLDGRFASALGAAKSKAMRPASGGTARLNKEAFAAARSGLWVYGPLVLFTKEMNAPAWGTVLRLYWSKAQPLYADCFKENLAGWKRVAKKPAAEEAELLFTAAEKDDAGSGGSGGLAAASRKLTVKRSQTLAKTLRNASGGNRSPTESRHPGQMMSSEAFAGATDEMAPLISQEQNFVVDIFHASSLENADFLEVVAQTPPEQRRGANLMQSKPMDPDREMAKRVQGVMAETFGFFAQEMGLMLEWAVSSDPIQGVGVMACLSRHTFYLQETSQEFLLQLLETLSSRLQNLWTKFVDEQVKAIEETKVRSKKRKGVIGFMKTFPPFSAAVENVFSAVAGQDYEGPAACMYEVRKAVDDAYSRVNRAMFDSLKVIAKEAPTAQTHSKMGGGDEEDKEMLNYYILIVENMNHYVEEVEDGGREGVLAEWRGKAMLERADALAGYVGMAIRRPLGELLTWLDSIESELVTHPNPTAIATRSFFTRKAARKVFSQYDSKMIRRDIETFRKRIEKHFGDADEEQISRQLVGFVCKECEREYERTLERMEKIVSVVYPPAEGEKPVEIEFTRADVQAGWRR